MQKQLVVIKGLERSRVLPLGDADVVQLGCSQTLEITARFRDPEVARVHCEVEVVGDRVVLSDAGTPGGTYLNGRRITREELRAGDVIRIGKTELKFICDGASPSKMDIALSPELSDTHSKPAPETEILDEKLLEPKATVGGSKPKATAEHLNLLVGRQFGNYKVGPIVGTGHWGRVFQARDVRNDKLLALKVLRPEFAEAKDNMRCLGAAVRAVVPLRHPNLVTYLGAGIAGPFPWIAMEMVEGKSLTQVVRRIQSTGMLDWRQTLPIAICAARALEAIEERGLRHGNLTPQVVLLRDADKQVKLTGLLLAKALEEVRLQPTGRLNEHIDDTPFMSPERTYGVTDIDIRSDIFSLGAILYALITGRPPFEGYNQGETVHHIRTDEPIKPRKYQPLLEEAYEASILKMMAKDPAERPQSPSQVSALLADVSKRCGLGTVTAAQ